MDGIFEKFEKLGVDSAPGQEGGQRGASLELRGGKLDGVSVDFSHGDVDAFLPIPGSYEAFEEGYKCGGKQAYTEYRGKQSVRQEVAGKLAQFTQAPIDPERELILTPGTQGALFLAMGSLVGKGDRVAIVEPDYFANRKLVEYFEGELVPIPMDYMNHSEEAGLNLEYLEQVFRKGIKLFLFSNPNNPTGAVYSYHEITMIARLAKKYDVALLVDELYSRQLFDGKKYTHLRAQEEIPDNLLTIMGPSKTESLSGYRLGAAFGSAYLITRMEKLQAIVSLRCAGYCQSVFERWFQEPEGFMEARIKEHQRIRDDIILVLKETEGVRVRTTDAGSYLFVDLQELDVDIQTFTKALRKLADVTVTPGTEFGPQFKSSFRINFSQDHDAAVAAIMRTMEIVKRYRK